MSKKQQKSGSFFIKNKAQKISFSQEISQTYVPQTDKMYTHLLSKKSSKKNFKKIKRYSFEM